MIYFYFFDVFFYFFFSLFFFFFFLLVSYANKFFYAYPEMQSGGIESLRFGSKRVLLTIFNEKNNEGCVC